MFWSAAMDLKTQRPLSRPSYGSFSTRAASSSIPSSGNSSSSSSNSFYIPQSIPEHQLVSQFTSPVAAAPDSRRGLVEEYVEGPRTALARTRALLQHSGDTQTALKQLLRGSSNVVSTTNLARTAARTSTLLDSDGARQPLLLKPRANEEPNPQEDSEEHNYWMQELERRRAGLRRSRRRTCMAARTATSPFRVGVVMLSVPLVLVLGFVVFVVLFGQALDASSSSGPSGGVGMKQEASDGGEAHGLSVEVTTRETSATVAARAEAVADENGSFGRKLSAVVTDPSGLRGVQEDTGVQ
ncbi:unnamed protein product [Hyaloperonospora brassicae]|uniref:RxLR effector candidate protein n=1 Tax=Hyaloperonospora brassicae TaxID=162125 RepID=A0AAV0USC6_HYABA|nr:unnamed protein product [Hyaloperonospora brassicae]